MTETTQDKKDQAMQAAGTAADEGKHVAGVAADEAKSVAGEAQQHVKGLLDEALVQVDDQTRTQRDRLASTLGSLGDDLHTMASDGGTNGVAADLARQVGDRAHALGQHLDGRDPADLLDDVRQFARQRPGVFLLGALAAGVVVGRLARGAKDAKSADSSSATTPSTTPSASTPPPAVTPAVTTPAPAASPSYVAPVADPLGLDDPAIGATVPPTSTGRYEP